MHSILFHLRLCELFRELDMKSGITADFNFSVERQNNLRKTLEQSVKDSKLELEVELSKVAPLVAQRLKVLFSLLILEESSSGINMDMVNNAIRTAEKVDQGKFSADAGMEVGFDYSEKNYNLPKGFYRHPQKVTAPYYYSTLYFV